MPKQEPHPQSLASCDRPLLDIKTLSRLLNIKPCTLYAWAAQGRIPCLKIHGLIRFHKDEIDTWMEDFRKLPKAQEPSPLRSAASNLNRLIARAKQAAYNSRHGETRQRSSPIGEEEADGAV